MAAEDGAARSARLAADTVAANELSEASSAKAAALRAVLIELENESKIARALAGAGGEDGSGGGGDGNGDPSAVYHRQAQPTQASLPTYDDLRLLRLRGELQAQSGDATREGEDGSARGGGGRASLRGSGNLTTGLGLGLGLLSVADQREIALPTTDASGSAGAGMTRETRSSSGDEVSIHFAPGAPPLLGLRHISSDEREAYDTRYRRDLAGDAGSVLASPGVGSDASQVWAAPPLPSTSMTTSVTTSMTHGTGAAGEAGTSLVAIGDDTSDSIGDEVEL